MKPAKPFAATHSQPLKKKMTPKYELYKNATDDSLFKLVHRLKPKSLGGLQKLDAPLYNEVGNRKALRARLGHSFAWRRGVEDWKSYQLSDWLNLCKQFASAAEFRNNYVAAQNAAYRSKLWPEIQKLMIESEQWSDQLYGMDGRRYDSRAELVVANWLYCSKIDYRSHPNLKLRGTKKLRKGDFLLPTIANVEVFMCSEKGFRQSQDLPSWSEEYLIKRQEKELYYEKQSLPFIAIEAEIYRAHGCKRYLSHIKEQFEKVDIGLCAPNNVPLEYSQNDPGIKWGLEDFINYAKANHILSISQFQHDAQDLYKLIHIKGLAKEVRITLDALHGRRSIAYKKDLRPIEDVRADCQRLNIIERTQYNKAYNKGLFPKDTPNSIRQSYGISWHEFIHGRKINDFWPWKSAKQFVRSQNFKSKIEFAKHPKRGGSWDFIRKSPAAPNGGYPEWTNWNDFLGNISPSKRQRAKANIELTNKLVRKFKTLDTKKSISYLKKLGLNNTRQLSKTNSRLYKSLLGRVDWKEIRDTLSSRIAKVKTSLEAIKILRAEKCFYVSDFLSQRGSNKNLQRIPIHTDRLGKGIFEKVRKSVGLPICDTKIRSSPYKTKYRSRKKLSD